MSRKVEGSKNNTKTPLVSSGASLSNASRVLLQRIYQKIPYIPRVIMMSPMVNGIEFGWFSFIFR